MSYEAYIVEVGVRAGKRYSNRRPLNVPLDLAVGHYEKLSDLQVREFLNDLLAEQERRREVQARRDANAKRMGGWTPDQSQRRAA